MCDGLYHHADMQNGTRDYEIVALCAVDISVWGGCSVVM